MAACCRISIQLSFSGPSSARNAVWGHINNLGLFSFRSEHPKPNTGPDGAARRGKQASNSLPIMSCSTMPMCLQLKESKLRSDRRASQRASERVGWRIVESRSPIGSDRVPVLSVLASNLCCLSSARGSTRRCRSLVMMKNTFGGRRTRRRDIRLQRLRGRSLEQYSKFTLRWTSNESRARSSRQQSKGFQHFRVAPTCNR